MVYTDVYRNHDKSVTRQINEVKNRAYLKLLSSDKHGSVYEVIPH